MRGKIMNGIDEIRTFYCAICEKQMPNWPRSRSVDEHGALMPAETTRDAHARMHVDFVTLGIAINDKAERVN